MSVTNNACHKQRFSTQKTAEIVLARVRKQDINNIEATKVACRVYECPKCQGWHITSWDRY